MSTQVIAIIQKDLKSTRSGLARLVMTEAAAIKRQGAEVVIISEKIKKSAFRTTGATIHKTFRWPIKGLFRRRFFMRRVQSKLNIIKPTLTIAHGDYRDADMCFIHNCVHYEYELINGTSLPESDVVGRIHQHVIGSRRYRMLICNSELMKMDLLRRYGLQDKRVEVLYPCFDEAGLSGMPDDVRSKFGIAGDVLVIGLITSGNFTKRNVALFLRVASRLSTTRSIHIVVAGDGSKDDYAALLAASLHPISFLPTIDKVIDYYGMLDIFVLPAHIEEFGMSVLEAMHFSLPVVVHKMVGASEILEGESTQFILPSIEPLELDRRLCRLVEDSALRERLGRQNERTAKNYSSSEQDRKFLDLVDELLVDKIKG